MIGTPRPPAPMKAASVAVPMVITPAVRTPAMIAGTASGSRTRAAPGLGHPQRGGGLDRPRIGVAHAGEGVPQDGEERVEPERGEAGQEPTPSSGIRKASSASDGMVCVMPIRRMIASAPAPALEQEPERHRDGRPATERRRESARCSRGAARASSCARPQVAEGRRAPAARRASPLGGRRDPRSRSTSRATTTSPRRCVSCRRRLARASSPSSAPASSARTSRSRGGARGSRRGPAARPRTAGRSRGRRRAPPGRGPAGGRRWCRRRARRGARRRRLVLEGLLHSLHAAEVEAVVARRPGRPSRALDELVVESRPQRLRNPRARSLMVARLLARRGGAGHGELPGVLEPERRQPHEVPAREELAPHAARASPAAPPRRLAEDRHQAGAGVLGIEVDRAGAQRLEAEVGAGEAERRSTARPSARLDDLREELGEEAALLEVLRADDDDGCSAASARMSRSSEQRPGRGRARPVAPSRPASVERL